MDSFPKKRPQRRKSKKYLKKLAFQREKKVSYFLDIFTFFCYNVEVKNKIKGGKANVKSRN